MSNRELPDQGIGHLEAIQMAAGLAADLADDPAEAATERKVVRAARALQMYGLLSPGEDPVDTMAVDLLTDLRHLCAGLNLDFEHLVARSATAFAAEDNWTDASGEHP